jgi:hypothetical protein
MCTASAGVMSSRTPWRAVSPLVPPIFIYIHARGYPSGDASRSRGYSPLVTLTPPLGVMSNLVYTPRPHFGFSNSCGQNPPRCHPAATRSPTLALRRGGAPSRGRCDALLIAPPLVLSCPEVGTLDKFLCISRDSSRSPCVSSSPSPRFIFCKTFPALCSSAMPPSEKLTASSS